MAPDAAQVSALVDAQVSVELPPAATLLGLALKDTVGGAAVTETVAELRAVPPPPVQVRTNLVVALNGTVVWLPFVGCAPVQPFDALHVLAFVEDQVSVEVVPLLTVVGFAEIVTTGVLEFTVTVADWEALPPAPVQESINIVVEVRAGVDTLPLRPSLPVQPPDAVQDVALAETQVSVEVAPLAIVLGFAESVTTGAGVLTDTVADCDALPPGPVQVNV
jgi:hypothetical protein